MPEHVVIIGSGPAGHTAALMATLSVRGFLRCVTRWGLAPFGWYRIGLAAVVWSVATLP